MGSGDALFQDTCSSLRTELKKALLGATADFGELIRRTGVSQVTVGMQIARCLAVLQVCISDLTFTFCLTTVHIGSEENPLTQSGLARVERAISACFTRARQAFVEQIHSSSSSAKVSPGKTIGSVKAEHKSGVELHRLCERGDCAAVRRYLMEERRVYEVRAGVSCPILEWRS